VTAKDRAISRRAKYFIDPFNLGFFQ